MSTPGEFTREAWERLQTSQCPRTLAVWKRGEPIEGVAHRPAWNGTVPMTGKWVCRLCGQEIAQ